MKYDPSRAQWRKSSYSGNTGNCVEVANLGPLIVVRDSKNPDGPKLVVSRAEWRRFLANGRTGAHDL
jgi:Domain of unknown function (DUF397)